MKFYITTWNHHPRSRDAIQDIILPIAAGLRDLGHEVTVGDRPPKLRHLNVVIENFPYKRLARQMTGHDYVVIATEELDGSGFNSNRTMYWRKRWANFQAVAQNARAIWVICDGGADKYMAIAPAIQITLGWSSALEKKLEYKSFDYDLCAFGKLDIPARRKVIDVLSSRLRVAGLDLQSKTVRDETLSRSLFSYGFRPYIDAKFASISRIVASLMAGVPIIHERVDQPSPFVEALETVDGPHQVVEQWEDLCVRRDQILQQQLAAWRSIPAADVMAAALTAMQPTRSHGWKKISAIFFSAFPRRGFKSI